jgi:hypothetical protein
MNIVSHEFRIKPNDSSVAIKKEIENILRVRKYHQSEMDWEKVLLGTSDVLELMNKDKIKNDELPLNDYHFVLHFFKKSDKNFQKNNGKPQSFDDVISSISKNRDSDVREQTEKQAKAIVHLREQHPEFAKVVRGIDAASSELATRPEAFAQAFRFLKNHQLRENNSEIKGSVVNNRLRLTFHAGEDFFDIVDGIRYIDESVFFLNMENGDRIGHAIALGIDAQKYYALKKNKIILTKHTLIDNLAWLLSKVRKFGLGKHINEVYRLETIFKSFFSEIYLNSCTDSSFQHIHYQQFFDAWKLRGDNPMVYFKYFDEYHKTMSLGDYFDSRKFITYWDRCGLNQFHPKFSSLRRRTEIAKLYHEYHYNPNVKNKGFEMTQFEITPEYIQLVHDVQFHMMHYIASLNIGIETNPTSNFLIGPIEKYAEHPISKWYNLGLESNHEKIQKSPQLSVSINTDDSGIFSTSLENEYALLAVALEKEVDENGKPLYKSAMIYDWLDRIREMGIQQSFGIRKKSDNL